MAVRKILQIGDEILRKKCEKVTKFDSELGMLLDDMKETVKLAKGAGLAGPQIGVSKKVFVVDVEEGFFEFVNPIILAKKGKQYGIEGCLSVAGKWGEVERPETVKVKFQDRKGRAHSITAHGFFAKAICHEYDHLDGILYVDKADNLREEV